MSVMTQPSSEQAPKTRVPAVITGVTPDQRARMQEMKSFKFNHSLGHFPALSIPNVAKLTERLIDEKRFEQVFCSMGDKSGYGR